MRNIRIFKIFVLAILFFNFLFSQQAFSEEIGVEIPPEPKNLAWWLKISFMPVDDAIRGIPVEEIDSSWTVASELTSKAALPDYPINNEYENDFLTNKMGFAMLGDFNNDKNEDLAIVGVYLTKEEEGGNFLLVLSKTDSGDWEKSYLKKWKGKKGFIIIDKVAKDKIKIWFCLYCDTAGALVWSNKKRTYNLVYPGEIG